MTSELITLARIRTRGQGDLQPTRCAKDADHAKLKTTATYMEAVGLEAREELGAHVVVIGDSKETGTLVFRSSLCCVITSLAEEIVY